MAIRRNDSFCRLIQAVGAPCLRSLYRVRIEGRENLPPEGPGILLPKHQFWTDIPIVGMAAGRPMSYIAKQELFVYPGVSHFIGALGGIPLDRGNPVKTLGTFRLLEKLLKEKEFVVLFPEGTYYPGSMGQGKHRLIERILRFQEKMGWRGEEAIAFIPVGIRYGKERLRPRVRVRIGRPVTADGNAEAREFTRAMLAQIAGLSGLGPES